MPPGHRKNSVPNFFDDGDVLPSLPQPTVVGNGQLAERRRTWARPRSGEPEQRFQHYVPVSMAKKIRMICSQHDYSYSRFFNIAVEEYIAKHYPKIAKK